MPLMKSKREEYLCVACDKFFEAPNSNKTTEQPKQQSTGSKPQVAQSTQKTNLNSEKIQKDSPLQKQQENSMRAVNQQMSGQNIPFSGNYMATSQSLPANIRSENSNLQQDRTLPPKNTDIAASNEELQFDPNFFEINLENYKVLSKLMSI